MAARARANLRLPPEVNRALYVRNLPFKITPEEMYDIFGKYGAIRQIRLGNAQVPPPTGPERSRGAAALAVPLGPTLDAGRPCCFATPGPHRAHAANRPARRSSRRVRAQDTRGTAFVVYEDIYDAKNAVDHLSGFNVCGRYLVVLYYQQTKMQKRLDTEREAKELAEMRARLGIDAGDGGLDLASK